MPPCNGASSPHTPSAIQAILDDALHRELLDSLGVVTGCAWSLEASMVDAATPDASRVGLDIRPDAPSVAIDICVDGDVPCRLHCLAESLPPEHMALARSIAKLIASDIAQRLACAREQSHRIATEAALSDHGRRLMLLVDSLPMLIHAHDKDGRYVFWNKECERVIGFTAEQMLSGDFPGVSYMYSAYADPLQKYREVHDASQDYRDKELTLRCADGQFRTFAWTNISRQCPIPGWDGWEVAVDITTRVKADRALQEQLRFMEALVHAVPFPLYIKDDSLHYISCNQAFADFVGRPIEHILGRRAGDILDQDMSVHIEEHDRSVLATGVSQHWQGRAMHADGDMRDLLIEKAAFRGYDDQPRGLICMFTDITRYKRHERQLERAKQQAEQASLAKTRFLANISHELRTPLNGIMGATELLLAEELTQEQLELMGMVRSSTTNLLRILNDILDLSSLDEGRLPITALPCNLHRALESLFKLFGVQAQWKHLQFSWIIEEDVPHDAVLDMQRLQQALSNIFWNALKFTDQGEIGIRVRRAPDTEAMPTPDTVPLRIEVRDSGIGIPSEHQERIFESFALAESVMTKKRGGVGLGLAISHKLISLMGGRLWVESQEHHGSTFIMELPVALP